MIVWLGFALGFVALGLSLYWALVITEGAYLGRRVVALLYDWTPGYYDRIKEITWKRDGECLVDPLFEWMEGVQRPLILDVGVGTGRFPKAMLSDERFEGQIWGLDLSIGMLRKARERMAPFDGRCTLIWEDADALPFPDETFDAVVCLEALEFTPRPEHTLGELMRVLRPGGVLLLTNRIGRARWFPGRTYNDDQIVELLVQYPLLRIEIHSWNTFYDQVWVRKFGVLSVAGRGVDGLADWLEDAEAYCVQEDIVKPIEWAKG
ncbi:MAG: class I SAM-dependent methyltransferase [Anaerolineae bacterium]|nr:class I SAM-dependent methyltransferase [Anaerolineae bacterium]